mgnify:CR=1 FL=1
MISSITQSYKYAFSLIIFIIALAYTVFLTTDAKSGFDELPTTQTVYSVNTKIPKEVNWTGSQVVGKLYRLSEDNIPIVVNGVTFSSDQDVMVNQGIIHLNGLYKQEVEYDTNGKVIRLMFTSQ